MRTCAIGLLLAVLAATGCETGGDASRTVSDDFRGGDPGWSSGCAEFPQAGEAEVGCVLEHGALPAPLSSQGLHQRGTSLGDGLLLWSARPVDGLVPGATYEVVFRGRLASAYPEGSTGVGGSTVAFAGAVPVEPARRSVPCGFGVSPSCWRMNFVPVPLDGPLPGGTYYGEHGPLVSLGDLETGGPDAGWAERPFASPHPVRSEASAEGRVWLVLGCQASADAAGLVEAYFTALEATLRRVDG